MQNRILNIVGGGGHGSVIADIARAIGTYREINFFDDSYHSNNVNALLQKNPDKFDILIGIGDNKTRLAIAEKFEKKGFSFATLLHPTLVVGSDVEIGVGTVAMAHTVINFASKIGKHCILNTGSTVDHHCELAEGVHIGPGSHLAGNVHVNVGTFFGTGSGAIPGVKIDSNVTVAAGAIVTHDIKSNIVVKGIPAK